MARILGPLVCVAAMATALSLVAKAGVAADAPGTGLLSGAQMGNPGLKTIGQISFGPGGLLLVAEPGAASIVAIETNDHGPVQKLKAKVENVRELVAGGIGAKPEDVVIADMTVNPASGKIYLSVQRKTDRLAAILTVDADGKLGNFSLDKVNYARVTLAGGPNAKVRNITDVEFAGDIVLAAGSSAEEFSSKIFSIPVPLVHGSTANTYSAETYHVAHGKWETKAPIQSFIPYQEDGKQYVVGAFACTPIAKFPIGDLSSGTNVKGTSVVELGSGNRPLDMFTYEKDGQLWLVTNTQRFKENLFGPSRFWGVRLNMDFLASSNTNEKAIRRNVKEKSGPEGIEVVDSLFGAVQVAKLGDTEMVVLRDKDDNGKLALEVSALP